MAGFDQKWREIATLTRIAYHSGGWGGDWIVEWSVNMFLFGYHHPLMQWSVQRSQVAGAIGLLLPKNKIALKETNTQAYGYF